MNPRSGKCQYCQHFNPVNNWCESISDAVAPWWTGCGRHKKRPVSEQDTKASVKVLIDGKPKV